MYHSCRPSSIKVHKLCLVLNFIMSINSATLQQWKGIASKAIKCISVNPSDNNYFAVSSSDA